MNPLLLVALLTSTPEVFCDPMNPTHCSHEVRRGEISLLDGQVLTTDLSLFLAQRAERYEAQLQAERARLEKLHEVEVKRLEEVHAANLRAATSSTAIYVREAAVWREIASPPFYLSDAAWFLYGVLTTALIVGLIYGEQVALSNIAD